VHYVGTELELFSSAVRWKAYVARLLRPYIRGDVLEVGAGIGAFTEYLRNERCAQWTCIEPDEKLFETLSDKFCRGPGEKSSSAICGTLSKTPSGAKYDAILYLDVLEHIENDRAEMAAAAEKLAPSGKLIVLSPAFPSVYSPFDAAIGHYRRYTRGSLRAIKPEGLREEKSFYIDAPGLLLSLANRLLLKKSYPTSAQIQFWDRAIVLVARLLDPLVFYSFGRSVVTIWSKV